ncbi:SDR family oxidoreductase [Microlunatus spumicola]|uniref:SDR family oxidoreductase n=1 Tax=Microlunatus spumicola TaxID=81499 RepID=UPI00195CB4FA
MSWPEEAVVVVTGAAGGIGLAVATWFAERGARVFSLDRPGTRPGVGEAVEVDVTSEESLAAAVRTVVERAGRVDALVAAAGVAERDTGAEDMTTEVWSRTIGVNLTGVFLSCREFGRVMLEQETGGRIVTIASMSGQHVVNVPQRQVAYNASKAGVVAMTKSLALEWAGRVRVNALSPGYVDTPLLTGASPLHPGWKERTPVARFATPAEVAAGVAWLLSDEAAFCVGTEMLMDGGYALA